jgi:hypothetical protein
MNFHNTKPKDLIQFVDIGTDLIQFVDIGTISLESWSNKHRRCHSIRVYPTCTTTENVEFLRDMIVEACKKHLRHTDLINDIAFALSLKDANWINIEITPHYNYPYIICRSCSLSILMFFINKIL